MAYLLLVYVISQEYVKCLFTINKGSGRVLGKIGMPILPKI